MSFVFKGGPVAAFALFVFVSQGFGAEAPLVSYNNQIEPILSEHCFHCHGPDSAARKPKKNPLRLDRPDFAYLPRDNGQPVILTNNPDASELVHRITSKDDDVMPPLSEQKPLSATEISLLRHWIAQGGKYEKHWSLIPPVKSAVPPDGAGWARNPIDHFVAHELAQNGLTPNPQEQRGRLFRRLSFDLTGLPPNQRDLAAFVRSGSDRAYEKAVDRMLASDASAEHFTRLWLDAVRYADTQGIHLDFARTIWPYRDWVIAAYKANMPFDVFTVKQIAGVLLPHPTELDKIASGYNRLLETTSEGGAIPEEYEAIYAKDRVDTTAAVWLGLTTGCATCHDHKFDPISMKDFYSLTAFFRNNTMAALDGPTGNAAPMLFVPAGKDERQWRKLQDEIPETRRAIAQRKHKAGPAFKRWLAANKLNPPAFKTPAIIELPLTESNGPAMGTARGKKIQWPGNTTNIAGPFGPAPLIAGGEIVQGAKPVIERKGQASFGAFIYVEDRPGGSVISRMNQSKDYRGWDLWMSDGYPAVHIIDKWPEKSLKVTAKERLEPGRWHHLMAVFDGRKKGAKAIALFIDGTNAAVDVNNNSLGTDISTDVPLRLGGRSSAGGPADLLAGGKVYLQGVRFYSQALGSADIARLALSGLARPAAKAKDDDLFQPYVIAYDKPTLKLQAKVVAMEAQEQEIRARGATTLIMQEKMKSKPIAYVLLRGNYMTKGAEVSANTPAALPPMSPGEPHNRLGLAEWIMSRQDPLVARVTVNRLWQQLFGTGIVETTGDFGVMGARPTDQKLLDWLAVEFMDSGWDFRHVVKMIVMSSTYRQSEEFSPDKLEKDPQNRLLSRGPHLRLDAEEIRDDALAASGLLVRKIGGPPVKPYQPEGVWEAVAMVNSDTRIYKQDTGDALYRRSLYTYWKRTAPPPNMEILDAPDRETFCTRRERTDTPLQALVTLNDTQLMEASRHLAARALLSSKNFDGRLDDITEALLARRFAPDERAIIHKTEQDFLQKYNSDPADAKSLLSVGESKVNPKLPPAELAAWTLVASEVFNLDESLTK